MNKKFLLIYLLIITVIIALLLIFANQMSDMTEMILFALIIIITSVFTYANRKQQ